MTTHSPEIIRERLKKIVRPCLSSVITDEEVELHFSNMPARYWLRVTVDELVNHLSMQHAYLNQSKTNEGDIPVIRWRHFLESDYSEVIVMTSDRHGLLAKMAGSFAAAKVNVFEADIYTRQDNIVLDVFKVCDAEYRRIKGKDTMEKVQEILKKSLSKHGDLPFDEMSENSSNSKKIEPLKKVKTKIEFNNESSEEFTVLNISTEDHLGLLHDILQVLTLSDADIEQAKISTEDGIAVDSFYIRNSSGKKMTNSDELEDLKRQLTEMILCGSTKSS
jgi:[protein-PII] uridylyltransferase